MGRFFILLFIIIAFCSCREEEKVVYKIGFSQCIVDVWREAMYQEMRRELLFHDDMEIIYRDAGADNAKQIGHIQGMLDEGIDLLIVSPNEPAPISPMIEKVYNMGIPVILLDRKISGEHFNA
ncbi:substrate-binding domain-containing protein [Marinoscillum sp. MHG1-6]|uniref:substrate-binding domain-containing protein n=1 Tax=Marinoscillum sp. MHG1-6 TaxID=2959627 RepID=UPI0021571C10|nr:substrate-binding domain-containing protein [Marinoscillum sp. MHG1-6]